jgi:ribosomal protein S21
MYHRFLLLAATLILLASGQAVYAVEPTIGSAFPPGLDSYNDAHMQGIFQILAHRVQQQPFNLVATLIFFAAIIHTFMAGSFMALSHKWADRHAEKIKRGEARRYSVDFRAELFHFLGEVEVVFGLWAIVLAGAIVAFYDWATVIHYLGHHVDFTEAAFVVVIMTLASTRPILRFAETAVTSIANCLGGSLAVLWMTILTLGPIMGSIITEPAAMTIAALMLSHKFYRLNPSHNFKYATVALLFVNVSVGGTLTHFAAPPVLMVAEPWHWDTVHMLTHFGWKAVVGILLVNSLYLVCFRNEFARLQHDHALQNMKDKIQKEFVTRERVEQHFSEAITMIESEQQLLASIDRTTRTLTDQIRERMLAEALPHFETEGLDPKLVREAFDNRFEEIRLSRMREKLPGLLPEEQRPQYLGPDWDEREDPVPFGITLVHLLFMVWTVSTAHYPPLFILGMLFFLGFARITRPFQNHIHLQPAMLVGFFLAGLVIHGGVQAWWIAPVLGGLSEGPLMLWSTVLTAFNDNAAITYLSTLVPGFTDTMKYAVVAGAVTGGGLTVIANAPNPAGQSILKHHFGGAVSPLKLALAALLPTLIIWLCFALLG